MEPDHLTLGVQLVDYAFAMLTAVATPVVAWVGWKISTWLTEKKIMSKAQADALVGANLDAGARKAIEYAKNLVELPVGTAVDLVANQNFIVKTAAQYLFPKMEESLDHFGFSPKDLEEFIRARLNLPPEVAPVVVAAPVIAATTLPTSKSGLPNRS